MSNETPTSHSVFQKREPAGKPVKAAKMAIGFWESVYKQAPRAMNIPETKDGQVDYAKLNKRREMLSKQLIGFTKQYKKWEEYTK